jgi:hypothetical protein
MSRDDLERILASERGVTPSPDFVSRVMSGVRREAALPPAIAFPWRRLRPILVACGAALAAAFVLFAILLSRSGAPLGTLERGPMIHIAAAVGASGLPLLLGMLSASWLLFRLSLRRPTGPQRMRSTAD